MYWIFGVKFVDLGDCCTVGGDPAMNIIIARVPVLNAPEYTHRVDHSSGDLLHRCVLREGS